MTEKIKVLSAKLADIWARYHDERSKMNSTAEETIRETMTSLKKTLGVAGLRVEFWHDETGGCHLEVKEKADSEWESWDDGFDHIDGEGRLQGLQENLDELAPYLEWQWVKIVV